MHFVLNIHTIAGIDAGQYKGGVDDDDHDDHDEDDGDDCDNNDACGCKEDGKRDGQ